MNKEFVPYEQALALKELGFESPYPIGGYQGGKIFYYEKGELYYDAQPMYSSNYHDGQILAPLYQQAFRWFREEHDLFLVIDESTRPQIKTRGGSCIRSTLLFEYEKDGNYSGVNYEEAELECLKKLIEITKNNIKNKQ